MYRADIWLLWEWIKSEKMVEPLMSFWKEIYHETFLHKYKNSKRIFFKAFTSSTLKISKKMESRQN